MSDLTDRQTPEDIRAIARIIFNVRQRLARAQAEAEAEAAAARDGGAGEPESAGHLER